MVRKDYTHLHTSSYRVRDATLGALPLKQFDLITLTLRSARQTTPHPDELFRAHQRPSHSPPLLETHEMKVRHVPSHSFFQLPSSGRRHPVGTRLEVTHPLEECR